MLRPKTGALVNGRNFISRWWHVSAIAVVAACMTAAPAVSRADIIEPFETAAHPFWTVDEVRAGAFKQAIDDAHGEGTVDHMSNAGLCGNNRGLTNAGVRLGIKF